MNGVANKLLLLTLIAQQHIVIGEPLNTFQLYNFEHTKIDVSRSCPALNTGSTHYSPGQKRGHCLIWNETLEYVSALQL